MIILDVEIYRDYFLCSCLNTENNKIKHFEAFDGQPLNRKQLHQLMSTQLTCGFNSNSFDLLIIAAAIKGWTIPNMKKLCDEIILGDSPAWMVAKKHDLNTSNWNHIDIIEVAQGKASLKIYGARLHAPTIQDLPIEPNASIEPHQREILREYCVNDVETTYLLYKSLEKQIALREQMSKQYNIDLRSKSDAQIAEAVIKSELTKTTGKRYYKPEIAASTKFSYKNPGIIDFKTEQLQNLFDDILKIRFGLQNNGSVKMPDELAKTNITIGRSTYNMGIGGLHSTEKSQYIEANDTYTLLDVDVASYYPNIILQQNLAPKTMGRAFLKVYQSIVERRLEAKGRGDKVTADTLKICVNGSFGKLGSKWSALYSPDLLLQTTITGQLALLMLIESLELLDGVHVVSANTDGIVIYCKRKLINEVRNVCFAWELSTSYELEETPYRLIASRDVNNYLAITTSDEIKRKGVFAVGGIAKNPDCNISYTAVAELLASGASIEQTIRNCKDITQFLIVRTVNGGAVWKGEFLGKAVRYYYSTEVNTDTNIEYKKNGNKVPRSDGAKPLMTLNNFPSDVDYQRYIDYANKLLKEVGYNA